MNRVIGCMHRKYHGHPQPDWLVLLYLKYYSMLAESIPLYIRTMADLDPDQTP